MLKLFENIKSSLKRKQEKNAYKKSFNNNFQIESYYAPNYKDPSKIDLITVTFNAPGVVEYQIKLMKKFLVGNYRIIICDNSTDEKSAREIKQICLNHDITYIRVQDRKTPNGFSNSHAIALNWIYKNVVKKRQNNFAFLDHDIFPVKETNIEEYVNDTPIFGKYYDIPGGIWYLWAGFSFFNYDHIKNMPMNFHRYKIFGFIKKRHADTGSANWPWLYKKLDRKKVKPCKDEWVEIEKGISVNMLDNWLHILDGGNRHNNNTDKISVVLKYLDNLIN